MKTIAIHQPQYLPYLGFFNKIKNCDQFVLLDNVQFMKNGLQNRNKIKTIQGWKWITVPVLHNFGQTIKEVRINTSSSWERKQWNTLVTNYHRSSFFDLYGESLRDILYQDFSDLCSLNTATIIWAMERLDISKPMVLASQLNATGKQTDHLISICIELGADTYLSGLGGKQYMDLTSFDKAGIRVTWQSFTAPEYPQVFPEMGFIPNMSIVDALFTCGPSTRELL